MLNKLLSTLMIIALIAAIAIGLFFRQSYTNVTAQSNFMENHFNVALWDLEIAPTLPQIMQEELPNSNIIIRAKSIGSDYSFKSFKQNVEVLEIYRGEGLKKGEKIAITDHAWQLYFDDMTANLSFVNLMQPGEEYLLFLDRKLENPYENNIYLLPELIIPPIFNYQDMDHVVVVPIDDLYVPYEKVKNNEFFVSSDEALQSLMEVKHILLQKYPR